MSPQQRLYAYYGGSVKTAALSLKVHEETVRIWLKKGIPIQRSMYVEKKTDGFVTAEEILRYWKKAA